MLNQRVSFELEQIRQEESRTRVSGDRCVSPGARRIGSTSAGESHQPNQSEELTESGAGADSRRVMP
jgi:hypothetical protein